MLTEPIADCDVALEDLVDCNERAVPALDPRHSGFDGLAYHPFGRQFGSVEDLRVDWNPSDEALGAGARFAPRAWGCQTVKITVSRI